MEQIRLANQSQKPRPLLYVLLPDRVSVPLNAQCMSGNFINNKSNHIRVKLNQATCVKNSKTDTYHADHRRNCCGERWQECSSLEW